jgi:hypothetical protein
MAREAGSRRTTRIPEEKWRRRPDLNRGWRFCRPYRVVTRSAWLRLLVPDGAWFSLVFGRSWSEVAPKSRSGARADDWRNPARHFGGMSDLHIPLNAAPSSNLARWGHRVSSCVRLCSPVTRAEIGTLPRASSSSPSATSREPMLASDRLTLRQATVAIS